MNKKRLPKLLVIGGPTATGKTALALSLARKVRGELISADSRQIYEGMDIGTGKDVPRGSVWKNLTRKLGSKSLGGYITPDSTPIWGYDIVSPTDGFSVAHYFKFVNLILPDILERGNTPILIGGTGLYIKAITEGIETAAIPRSDSLRSLLSNKSIKDLFEQLSQLDPVKAAALNQSDKKNPRRLVRAIEIAQWKLSGKTSPNKMPEWDILFIGLTAPSEVLHKRIRKRIEARLNMGFEEELHRLLTKGVTWDHQSMNSLGYKQWQDYYLNKVSKEAAIKNWFTAEKKYMKRQMTWFKRVKNITWVDITSKDYQKLVENIVLTWYASGNGSSTKV